LRQIRPTVERDTPLRLAIEVRDQCVASGGCCSSVATITSSTLSNRIEGGRPGRGSSISPSRRLLTNRRRHLPTVGWDTPNFAATALLDRPSPQARMIRDRNANACDDFARRDHAIS